MLVTSVTAKAHASRLMVALNDHPADGLRAYEDDYEAAAKEYGIDPATEEPIQFDFTSKKFVDIYFKYCHVCFPSDPKYRFGCQTPSLDLIASARRHRHPILVARLAARRALANERRRPSVSAQSFLLS